MKTQLMKYAVSLYDTEGNRLVRRKHFNDKKNALEIARTIEQAGLLTKTKYTAHYIIVEEKKNENMLEIIYISKVF
jgi:hypothetical protein